MVTRVHTELARSGSNSASHTIKVTEANSGVVVFFTGTRGHVGGGQLASGSSIGRGTIAGPAAPSDEDGHSVGGSGMAGVQMG